MSMVDDDKTPNDGVMSDDMMTAQEAAEFEAMRSGADVPDPAPAGDVAPATDGQQPPAEPHQNDGDGDLPDVDVLEADGRTKSRRVSLNKFLRVERLAKERETQLQAYQEQMRQQHEERTRLDERLRIINEAINSQNQHAEQQQAAQQAPQIPDPDQDIFSAVKYLMEQQQRVAQQTQQVQQNIQQRDVETDIAQRYQQDAIRFAQTEPTFLNGYQHLYRMRDAQLAIAGHADPAVRNKMIVREEQGLVRDAIARGKSPAQTMFEMAKAMGFTPTPPAPNPGVAAPPAQGSPPSPAAGGATLQQMARALPGSAPQQQAGNGQQGVSVAEQVANIARGQAAAQSLSNAGGGAAPQSLTNEALLNMSEEEFGELVANLPKSQQMNILGH